MLLFLSAYWLTGFGVGTQQLEFKTPIDPKKYCIFIHIYRKSLNHVISFNRNLRGGWRSSFGA